MRGNHSDVCKVLQIAPGSYWKVWDVTGCVNYCKNITGNTKHDNYYKEKRNTLPNICACFF